MSEIRYLMDPSAKSLVAFINSPLWAEVKLCLKDRMCEAPDVKDPSHIAAAKGHKRAAFEEAIQAIENLPLETDESPASAFDRPAVAYQQD